MDWTWGTRERENDSIVGWMALPLTEMEKVSGVVKSRNLVLGLFSLRCPLDV